MRDVRAYIILPFSAVLRTAEYLSQLISHPPTQSPWYRAKVLLFLNPFSGHGLAKKIYQDLVEPVFLQHQIDCTIVETQYANHAHEYLSDRRHDLSQYRLCLLISGDGLLNEVLNAIVTRHLPSDLLPTSPSFHSALHSALHQLPIALMPGGTSNGLVTSLFGREADIVDIIKRIMATPPRSVDIMSIESPVENVQHDPSATDYSLTMEQTKPKVRVDMLTFLYGIVADNGQTQALKPVTTFAMKR